MASSDKVTDYIKGFDDWRGETLRELRQLINEAVPQLTEDFKWSVPVWTHNGLVCAISAFKGHVKINFFKGVYLPDPKNLINSGLESKEHRSINFSENDKPEKAALKQLVKDAFAYNNG